MGSPHLTPLHFEERHAPQRARPPRRFTAPLAEPRDLTTRIASGFHFEGIRFHNEALVLIRRYGRRNGPRILVLGGAGRSRFIAGEHGWWRTLAAPGGAINLNQFAVLGAAASSASANAASSIGSMPGLLEVALARFNLFPLHAVIACAEGADIAVELAARRRAQIEQLCLISPTLSERSASVLPHVEAQVTLVACGEPKRALSELQALGGLVRNLKAQHALRSPFGGETYLNAPGELAPILKALISERP